MLGNRPLGDQRRPVLGHVVLQGPGGLTADPQRPVVDQPGTNLGNLRFGMGGQLFRHAAIRGPPFLDAQAGRIDLFTDIALGDAP